MFCEIVNNPHPVCIQVHELLCTKVWQIEASDGRQIEWVPLKLYRVRSAAT